MSMSGAPLSPTGVLQRRDALFNFALYTGGFAPQSAAYWRSTGAVCSG